MDSTSKVKNKLFCAYFIVLSLGVMLAVDCAPITSCSRTPYPDTCNYYIDDVKLLASLQASESVFRDVVFKVTLDQAVRAHQLVESIDLSSFDDRARSAWSDCLELYEDTICHLNSSMSSKNVHPKDSQTWLSAAITNHATCENGFKELNLDSHYSKSFPSMLSNFSKLLSNSLAIEKYHPTSSTSFLGGHGRRLLAAGDMQLPSWLSVADRRLLQSTVKADLVVAKDGSGNFKTISEAVAAAGKMGGGKRFVIYVKAGVYSENVEIMRAIKNLMMVGDGIGSTVVTGSKNAQDGSTTFRSATFAVTGGGFIAKGISFRNTAGPQKHQAVALRSGSDFSVFYSCSFEGYQDTLYVYAQRQFYRDCDIYGTIDFIFGNAVVVFQNCNIYPRKPMSGQWNTVTAQARTDPNQNTGIIIHNSRVTASSDLKSVQGSVKTYLGRPWQKYSRTVFMKTSLDSVVASQGWLAWSGNFALDTLYYGEYMNSGPGSDTSGRVKWPGYRVITSATEAGKFTVGDFLAGDSWLSGTGVPFSAGL